MTDNDEGGNDWAEPAAEGHDTAPVVDLNAVHAKLIVRGVVSLLELLDDDNLSTAKDGLDQARDWDRVEKAATGNIMPFTINLDVLEDEAEGAEQNYLSGCDQIGVLYPAHKTGICA